MPFDRREAVVKEKYAEFISQAAALPSICAL
jgi:hypothetical protein